MKREKYPPLKPWQQEVVKKHEVRNRLLKGTQHERAKYWYMMTERISEEEFDRDEERIKKTTKYRSSVFRQGVVMLVKELAKSFGMRDSNGRQV